MAKPVKWKRSSNGLQSQNKVQRWTQLEKTSEIAVWIVKIRQEMTEILNFHIFYSFESQNLAHIYFQTAAAPLGPIVSFRGSSGVST